MISGNFYQHLTKDKQRIVDGRSRIYYSELDQYYSNNAFRNFSIKLPLEGTVNYKTDKYEYNLEPNHFLLISKQPGKVFFDNNIKVKSICIDINDTTFAETFTVLSGKKEINLDNLQASYFFSPDFFENIYHLESNDLGKVLGYVIDIIKNDQPQEINEETFLRLSEEIIFHQYSNYQSLYAITSTKPSTKKEILRRLLAAKNFMDDSYLINPSISRIATVANLSEYHFFRSFRQAFGVTPYQYMLQKRLEHSRVLIQNGYLIDDAAAACSFSDIFSFSKAFKKKYHYPPSLFKSKKP